jgi:hypothetical protein
MEMARDGSETVVTARVSGNSAGSPTDIKHPFTLDGEKLASMEIRS